MWEDNPEHGQLIVEIIEKENLVPVLDQGMTSVFMAGAMIFVAYEGFQLITNAVCETDDLENHNLLINGASQGGRQT